jgi:hypothetical protein
MDKKVQPKENAGAVGAGFEGRTGSNSYSALPRSSNASLGIDLEVATGVGYAVSNTNYGSAQNVGAKEGSSSNKNLGIDDEAGPVGTVGARENMGGYGPADDRGQFGVSAKSGGHAEGSTADTLGSGSRAKGTTGNESAQPGRSGSMAFAAKGLNATSSGPSFNPQKRAGSSKSLVDAEGGIKKKATW